MKCLSDEWSSIYQLTEDGLIYNTDTKKYIKPDKENRFTLKTADGKRKRISLRVLYKQVYNQWFVRDHIEPLSEDEEWRVIPQTDNKYFISSYGRVKSLCGYEAIILKPSHVNGYERVTIIENGSCVNRLVSRLVAAAFLPAPKSINYQLHHKNGKLDNRACSLEWLSPAEHRAIHAKENKS